MQKNITLLIGTAGLLLLTYAGRGQSDSLPAGQAQKTTRQIHAAKQRGHILRERGLHKLRVFLGTWQASSLVDSSHPNPVSAVYTCEWSPYGRYLVADQQVNNNGAHVNNLSIYNYNESEDRYTLSLVGLPGMKPFDMHVEYNGDTLFYNSEYMDSSGRTVYNRTINVFLSHSRYIYKIQFSGDGVNWTTNGEGSAVRLRRAPKAEPGPDMAWFDKQVGTWRYEKHIVSIPHNIAIPPKGYICRWSSNKQYLITDEVTKLKNQRPLSFSALEIYHYNDQTKKYILTFVGVPTMDPFDLAVEIRGDSTITLSSASTSQQSRTVYTWPSKKRCHYYSETSTDGTEWKKDEEGWLRRVGK